MYMYLHVNGQVLKVELANNKSTRQLYRMLEDGIITLHMKDYGRLEKAGQLPRDIASSDQMSSTTAGDIVLSKGKTLLISYDNNEWQFTYLGKIQDISRMSLMNILGKGAVDVTLSSTASIKNGLFK